MVKDNVVLTTAKSDIYHHVGASLYFLIIFICTSGRSLVLFFHCLQIVFP